MSTVRIRDLKTKVEKADRGHYYIQLHRKDGKFKTSHIKITGAEKMFQKDPHFVYVRPLRHAGNSSDIHDFLVGAGFDESQVKKYMKDSYSVSNFISMLNEYNREVSKIPSLPPKAKQERAKVTMQHILNLGKSMEGFKLESAPARASSPVPSTPKLSTGGGKADLKGRLSTLDEDKVLEITNFNSEKKSGLKTIKKPIKGSKHAIGNTTDLKKIYYDFAQPVDNGIAALVYFGINQEKANKIMRDPAHSKYNDLSNIAVKH
jgi:hypothetical protein